MKRYFCNQCKSELIEDYNTTRRSEAYEIYCPMCENDVKMQPIPEWETPNQYKARTGREWKGAVWVRFDIKHLKVEKNYTEWKITVFYDDIHHDQMLCADKDCAPPDDYKQEE